MAYALQITNKALAEIDEALAFRAHRSVAAAVRWHVKLMDAIRSLPDNPERWPLAPESDWYPGIRELNFGKRGDIYRILFEIRGDVVYVLRIRHGAQDALDSTNL